MKRAVSGPLVKPNFLILGTAKSGTSSLARYLALHPDVCFSKVTEPNFFAFESQFERGTDYYESLFDHYSGERMIGEKSWRYACGDVYPEAAKRIAAFLPRLKLIYMVRDPLPRAISMWRELRNAGQDLVSADPEIALLTDPLITDSMKYLSTFARFGKMYGEENLLILFFEDLEVDAQSTFDAVTRFLEIDHFAPLRDIHENKSVDRRSDRWFLEWLRKRHLDELARRLLPPPFRSLARLTMKKPIDQVSISDSIRSKFLDSVREEAIGLLTVADKPYTFWNLG